jgi:pimeloyl-ACP methyl ester carboxylesterase
MDFENQGNNTVTDVRIKVEPILVENICGEMLRGDLYRAPERTKHLIIICHGLGMNKDHRLMKSICETFSARGINAFSFSFSGYAPSQGKQQDSSYTKQARDLCSVIDYFTYKYCEKNDNQGNEGRQIMSVAGHSGGGTAAIRQAAFDRRIKSLLLIAPRIDNRNSIIVKAVEEKEGRSLGQILKDPHIPFPYYVSIEGRPFVFSKRHLEELDDKEIILDCLKAITIPIIVFRGTQDKKVPESEIDLAWNSNNAIQRVTVAGGHTFKNSTDNLIDSVFNHYMSCREQLPSLHAGA